MKLISRIDDGAGLLDQEIAHIIRGIEVGGFVDLLDAEKRSPLLVIESTARPSHHCSADGRPRETLLSSPRRSAKPGLENQMMDLISQAK
jgi:hypothetical protein